MQVPDTDAEFLSVGIFKAELARRGPLFECVQRYSQGLVALMMHSTACMALHEVQERCCRWLLMTHDRVRRDDFQLSQEFLAIMVGSTRPTVSLIASTLQNAGLISYKHGHMTIVDRPGVGGGVVRVLRHRQGPVRSARPVTPQPSPTDSLHQRLRGNLRSLLSTSPHHPRHPSRTPTVMLVDGDEDSMAMYAIGLLGMGFQPFTAGNAEEAYARARDLHPHVVVAEVALPGCSGLELARQLREDAETSNAAIIVLTGRAVASVKRQAAEAGCDRFLVKPCMPDTLAVEIRDVLARRNGAGWDPKR